MPRTPAKRRDPAPPWQPLADTAAMRIGWARRARGISQQQLAQACGVALRTLQGWESGSYLPSAPALVRLADALGSSCDYLLGRCDVGRS